MNSERPHAGRAALVVGGSGGIGGAVARRLGRLGARVAVGYHTRPDAAEGVARHIREAGGEARAVPIDVRDPEACKASTLAAAQAVGGLDILVYAAGIDLWQTADRTTGAEWRSVMSVNLDGAFFAVQAALPWMLRRGWGRIVTIGSIWGEVGAAGEVAYSAAKAGLSGMTKALAKEVARSGVTVNAVAPGVIDTDMNARFDAGERAALMARVPLGRMGTRDDVAGPVAYLVSDDASYVTGHVLVVTGGFDPLP